jgi:hypothetical protein
LTDQDPQGKVRASPKICKRWKWKDFCDSPGKPRFFWKSQFGMYSPGAGVCNILLTRGRGLLQGAHQGLAVTGGVRVQIEASQIQMRQTRVASQGVSAWGGRDLRQTRPAVTRGYARPVRGSRLKCPAPDGGCSCGVGGPGGGLVGVAVGVTGVGGCGWRVTHLCWKDSSLHPHPPSRSRDLICRHYILYTVHFGVVPIEMFKIAVA